MFSLPTFITAPQDVLASLKEQNMFLSFCSGFCLRPGKKAQDTDNMSNSDKSSGVR